MNGPVPFSAGVSVGDERDDGNQGEKAGEKAQDGHGVPPMRSSNSAIFSLALRQRLVQIL